jgi:hypothetical protein
LTASAIFRQAHRDVARKIAVRGLASALHFDVDVALGGRYQGVRQCGQRLPQQGLDQGLQGRSVDKSGE